MSNQPKTCPTCRRAFVLPKTHEQRKKFHKLCRLIGAELGDTMGHVKNSIKQDVYGVDEYKLAGKWYRSIRSTEDDDRIEYSQLIEDTYRWAAERDIYLPDVK